MTSASPVRILLLSDIHYAGPVERSRHDFLLEGVESPIARWALQAYRSRVWLDDPTGRNDFLDRCLESAGEVDWVIANGDYSCDTRFVGVSDPGALQSCHLCLERLRRHAGDRLRLVMGDHELGKRSLGGGMGGLRWDSLELARTTLGIPQGWREDVGRYTLVSVTSSLISLPVLEAETLVEEREKWAQERAGHLAWVEETFQSIPRTQKIVLFCHDPTALPFLGESDGVRSRMGQLEQTWIGHLHSPLILWKSRLLAGMPAVGRKGTTVRRLTTALRRARQWRDFRVHLCPSLTGIQLLKDGGFWKLTLDPEGEKSVQTEFHPLKWV